MKREPAPWWLTGGLIPAALVSANALMLFAFGERLPEPVATHWSFGGEPNGTMPLIVLTLLILGGCAVSWLGMWVARRNPGRSLSVALAYFIIGLLTGVTATTIAANLDAGDWTNATLEPWAVPVLVFAALVAGWIGLLLGGGSTFIPDPEVTDAQPTVDLEAGHDAVWSGSSGSLVLVTIGLVAVAVALLAGGGFGVFLALIVGIPILMLSAVRVTVSGRGITTTLGWLGWPRRTTRYDDIEVVTVIEVRPSEFGGWGYRIRPGLRAIVIRAGEAIRIDRKGKAALVITVDDARRGAGLANDLLQRKRSGAL